MSEVRLSAMPAVKRRLDRSRSAECSSPSSPGREGADLGCATRDIVVLVDGELTKVAL